MAFGYNGQILRVDLSCGEIDIQQPDPLFYRRYFGGRGFAGYFLLKELSPGIDPLGPENCLVFASSVLSGVAVPGLSRFSVAAKSPLTGGFGDSEAGGWWGPELKRAGFDAIIIKGRSPKPVYLWIHDGIAELEDAARYWGKTTGETQEGIRQDLGDKRIRMALIGPAGENQVRYACILNELKHANGRAGLGAVMGSKNLKAIAVRGTKQVEPHDPARVREITKWLVGELKSNPFCRTIAASGTASLLESINALGALPTRNFQSGYFEKAHSIGWDAYEEQIFNKGETCFGCSIGCKRQVKELKAPYELDPCYGGPEYESLAAFGSNCGIDDIRVIARANQQCNAYGIDVISAGATIAFAMECFEKGILTGADVDGLELNFGNSDAALELLEMIAERRGIGDLLAEGVEHAAKEIGPDAVPFAIHVKGQPIPMHAVRSRFGVGLGYAISNTGADHLVFPFDTLFQQENSFALSQLNPLGILEPVDMADYSPHKMRLLYHTESIYSLWSTAGACNFVFAPRSPFTLNRFVEMVSAITGWETSLYELMKIGERSTNLARAFNARENFTRDDDTLPERFFLDSDIGQSAEVGIYREHLEEALTIFYQMKGWDPSTGVPTKVKLEELNIGWVAELISKEND